MKSKFLFWLMFGFAVLLAIYIAVRMSMVLMGQGGVLSTIKKVSVNAIGGGDARQLAGRLDIAPGAKSLDMEDALAKIMADPDVALASVRRMPNSEIRVRAKMRVVVAAWTDGEKYYPLDSNGTPISRQLDSRPQSTLVFSGKVPSDISEVLTVMRRAPDLFYRTDKMEFVENRRWDIFLMGGIRIMLPEENFVDAVKKIEKMHKQNAILDRQIRVLDMRDTSRPLVKLK
ncbi:MAG: cell division protein FtsQ/DivIB [Alphaproteobacteria bacterium]|nr:cell division protein FtsQ/DivIB [Alphaproteobacteria bacterium]